MPPRRYSRLQFTAGVADDAGRNLLTGRERFLYQSFPDNLVHIVSEGEDLFHIAGRYFSALPRGCGLWWVIADFQPTPIHDPTLRLKAGDELIIPSVRTVSEYVFDRRRSREAVP